MTLHAEAENALVKPARAPAKKIVHFRVSERRALLVLADLIALPLAVLGAMFIWTRFSLETFDTHFVRDHWHWMAILPVVWLFLAYVNDYYQLRTATRILYSARQLALIAAELLIVYTVVYFFLPPNTLPRLFVLGFVALALVTSGSARAVRLRLASVASLRRRVLIVGAGNVAAMMWRALKEEATNDYEVVGCVTSFHDNMSLPMYVDLLGFGAELPEIVQRHNIPEIIMAYINEVPEDIFEGLLSCYEQGIAVVPMPVLYEEVTGRVPIEHVGERLWSLVLPLDTQSLRMKVNQFIKRIIDIGMSLIGLILFAPLFLLLAIAIKLDSRGPVLYRQRRVGRGGKEFTIVKLRSMSADAEKRSGPMWASENDPRITRVGAFLRKTRLDEVPQLLNVLRGEMSMIGPRPERPEFVAMLAEQIPFYRSRLVVKPGLTGWAQVKYRYGSSVDDALYKLQYDLYYIRRQSVMLDLSIMAKTISVMLRFQGT